MWTIEQGEIPLLTDTTTYDLPVDTVDLLDHVIRTGTGTSQTDLHIERMSMPTYASIPNKLATGRPNRIYINRKSGAIDSTGTVQYPQVTVWPVPADDTYILVYWRMRRIQDSGGGVGTQDIPFRFLPCLIAGLAFYLSQKVPEGMPRRMDLKQDYEEQWELAAGEDREKASIFVQPRIY
jgi:hypothetical protein